MKRMIAVAIALTITAFVAAGCENGSGNKKDSAQESGERLTEKAFSQQSTAVPYPVDKLKDSLERRNLTERLLRTNKPDAISYIYLLSFGKPLGYYTLKGKVSSTQSQMTTSDLVEWKKWGSGGGGSAVTTAPGDDGSYGENETGIFFFTTEGTMVTTNLDYIVSDQTLPFNVPELVS